LFVVVFFSAADLAGQLYAEIYKVRYLPQRAVVH